MSETSAEDDLIARYFAPLAGEAGLGLRDDAARLAPPSGCDLVVTADALVAGVHFFADDPAAAIAKKALRVNLSDLAAKAAEPLGFVLTIALPGDFGEARLAQFAQGLGEDSRDFACPLIGGDTVATPGPLTLSITAFGAVPHGGMIRRAAVAPGDRFYVTGSIGDAALGLDLRLRGREAEPGLAVDARDELLERFLLPRPRLALRAALRRYARAAMDVSDGLIGDLTKMARASEVGARVRLADVPLSSAARAFIGDDQGRFETALTGGDDYEILAAVAPEQAAAFEAEAAAAGLSATWIGEALSGRDPPVFEDASGRPRVFARPSFSHF